jgi:diacylglycerol kinase (ATP)
VDPQSSFKSRGGLRRLAAATTYSMNGFAAAWRHEASFRQEIVAGLVLAPLAVWLAPSALHALAMIGAIVFVWLVELLNSAIETLADAVSLEHHPMIGRAKDIGSAAVLLSLVLAAGVWLIVLWPRPAGGG